MQTNLLHLHSKIKTGEDAILWGRLKNGDENALGTIYTIYFKKLYNYGSRFIQDSGRIEDCIQDLFVDIWNSREKLGDVNFIKLYLFTCLRRKILNMQTKLVRHDVLESFPLTLSHKSHYLNQQIDKEVRQQLVQVLNRLTAQQKEAIFLVYYDELSYKEAADVMGLKIRTVYNLVHEALLRLREHKKDISLFSFVLFF